MYRKFQSLLNLFCKRSVISSNTITYYIFSFRSTRWPAWTRTRSTWYRSGCRTRRATAPRPSWSSWPMKEVIKSGRNHQSKIICECFLGNFDRRSLLKSSEMKLFWKPRLSSPQKSFLQSVKKILFLIFGQKQTQEIVFKEIFRAEILSKFCPTEI